MVGAAAALGVTKVRLTGGEPLVRRDLERLVAMLAAVEGISDLALTTNGTLLAAKARPLREAGLSRVTVSLDSLDEDVFRAMNDMGVPLARVLEGIAAAREGRVLAGQTQHGRQARRQRPRPGRPGPLRPRQRRGRAVHRVHGRGHDQRLAPGRRRPRRRGHPASTPSCPWSRSGRTIGARSPTAIATATGREIGVIASVTQPFCRDCTRARLSTDGKLYTCLFAGAGHDLRALLRQGANDDDLRGADPHLAGTRRPLLRAARRAGPPTGSRCPTSAAS